MQMELDGMGLPVTVRIHGVNETGQDRSNASACQGKDLPWLQETPEKSVWASWSVTYRDVIILNEANEVVAVYNLTNNNLGDPVKYDELRSMFIGFAGGE